MKTAVLLSGGKDSVAACWRAIQSGVEICCFITIRSRNNESYMFHTPNISLTRLQAEAAEIPLIERETEGIEEEELTDLNTAILQAKQKFGIEAVITGAIRSVYQAARVERICHMHGLWCFSPLWLCDEEEYLKSLIREGFLIQIVGVFAGPFTEEWLGKTIDPELITRLVFLRDRYGISVAGEGGEYESFVLDAPYFHRKIRVLDGKAEYNRDNGRFSITRAELEA